MIIIVKMSNKDSHPEAPDSQNESPDQEALDRLRVQYEQEIKNLKLRSLADLQNVRKEAMRSVQDAIDREQLKMTKSLLEILDSFGYLTKQESPDQALVDSIKTLYGMILSFLNVIDVSVISPKDEPLNPYEHSIEGMMYDNDLPNNTVAEVVQCGYKKGSVVIRPARVIVNTHCSHKS